MDNRDLFKKILDIIDAHEAENVDYVLIGGFAMVLYGMPWVTQDIDLFLKSHDDNIKRLQSAHCKSSAKRMKQTPCNRCIHA